MISEASEPVETSKYLFSAISTSNPSGSVPIDGCRSMDASPRLRAELLDLDAWGDILATYGRTMRVAVALTDPQGQILGKCHNAQPVWRLIHDATPDWGDRCPFCIGRHLPCTAVAEALRTGEAVMVHDEARLAHVAVPLQLNKHPLGAIVAGQVFDRYPEPLPLRRVAREFSVSAQQLWDLAKKQRPVSSAVLQASGDLLLALGHAFLQQRYGAILEAELAEANGSFRLLVEGVRDHALFTVDPTGSVTSWNGGAERLFGYLEAEIVGQNFSCMFTSEDVQNGILAKQLQKTLQVGRADDVEWLLRGKRKQFWANVSITALLENAGPVRGFTIIVQDVTERRQIAIVLEETRRERERFQEKLLSHVSHELRTPLTAIYMFTTNVLDGLFGDLTPEQREHLTFALDNIKQLKSMVSDLLDITRVETHKLTIEPEHTSAVKLVAEALSTCRTNAAVKNITLSSNVAPGLPFVWADPARVRQVLINLIDNGLKFTPESGTVTVEIQRLPETNLFLCLSVSDTGCGISSENREIIFNRLAQIENNVEASRSGLGLGLFISRELVSRHGGRIWVESQLGHGSTFYFTLPAFSLAKLCAHILTTPNLETGFVTLIAVDVIAIEGAVHADIQLEIRKVLERCIHPGQDVLLPSMSDVEPVESFFIVACTDAAGFGIIASRIAREMQNFDNSSQLKRVISSTTLRVARGQSRKEQIDAVTAQIDTLVQAHLLGKERLR